MIIYGVRRKRFTRIIHDVVCIIAALFFILGAQNISAADDLIATIDQQRANLTKDSNLRLALIGNKLLNCVDQRRDRRKFVALPFVTIDVNEATKKLYNLKEKEGAVIVQIASPNDFDGIAVNDVIVGLDGIHIKSSDHLGSVLSRIYGLDSVVIRISRDGSEREMRIRIPNKPVNLNFAVSMKDGEMTSETKMGVVMVSPVLLQFVETDDELAYVLAVEIAHAYLDHQRTTVRDTRADATQAFAEAIVGALVNSRYVTKTYSINLMTGPYRIEDEIEADKMAVDLLSRAGIDVNVAYTFLAKVETEIAKTNNAYSKSYSQIHPVNIDRITLLKKYLDEFKNKQAEKKEERTDSKGNAPLAADLELGATLNNGSDHDEYKLRSSMLSERFFGQDVYTGLVFYDNIKEIFWQGSIEETYQWFEVGNIKLELFDPSGEKRQTCENSYAVSSIDESYMDCTIPMDEIKGVIQPGLWKLKVFRSKALVDERLLLIKALSSPKVFLKKRSDIVSRHSIANP